MVQVSVSVLLGNPIGSPSRLVLEEHDRKRTMIQLLELLERAKVAGKFQLGRRLKDLRCLSD